MGSKSYSKGISWINDCRIPTTDKQQVLVNEGNKNIFDNSRKEPVSDGKKIKFIEPIGRFPANILVSDDMLNDGNSGGSSYCSPTKYEYEMSNEKFNSGGRRTKTGIGDKGTNSRYYDIDKWFDNILND